MKDCVLSLVSIIILSACCAEKNDNSNPISDMKIYSTEFKEAGRIPDKYTCVGQEVNPPLTFSDIPAETKTLALIMEDPDAPRGTFNHWILWNMPVISGIDEDSVPSGANEGTNSGNKIGYGGPCPPPGKPHRYFFKLFALDYAIDLPMGSTKDRLESAMKGHIISQAQLIGLYSR